METSTVNEWLYESCFQAVFEITDGEVAIGLGADAWRCRNVQWSNIIRVTTSEELGVPLESLVTTSEESTNGSDGAPVAAIWSKSASICFIISLI